MIRHSVRPAPLVLVLAACTFSPVMMAGMRVQIVSDALADDSLLLAVN